MSSAPCNGEYNVHMIMPHFYSYGNSPMLVNSTSVTGVTKASSLEILAGGLRAIAVARVPAGST